MIATRGQGSNTLKPVLHDNCKVANVCCLLRLIPRMSVDHVVSISYNHVTVDFFNVKIFSSESFCQIILKS